MITLPTTSEQAAADHLYTYYAALRLSGFSADEALQLLIALILA